MIIHSLSINEVILQEVGVRIKKRRISMGLTQKELAEEADVSLKTINNVEKGENTSFTNIISILRVLRLLDNINVLVPEGKTNPYDLLKLGKPRSRVRKTSKENHNGWKWGDE